MSRLPNSIFSFLGGGPLHGQHRKTATEIRQHTLGVSGPSPGGAFDPLAASAALQRAALRAAYTNALMSFNTITDPESPVENTGIEVGETIAWRAWGVSNNWLYSINFEKEWHPGKAVESERVDLGWGVHAFKDRLRAIDYARGWLTTGGVRPASHYFGSHLYVIGQVALWGDIWEFTDGWHAQYARVESIDLMLGVGDESDRIDQIRKNYGVESGTKP